MTRFRTRPGTRSASRRLKRPIPDIRTFALIIRKLALENPFGCTSYHTVRKVHPPVKAIRERYTAKFVYLDAKGKQIGSSSEIYDSVDGYEIGKAAMITSMANIAAHRGKIVHLPDADLYSATLKCHDPSGELYFVSLTREKITVSSYTDDAILKTVEKWAGTVPELA
ncbi:hypothetical protein [Methanoregula sp.]|uniref:hypothetical protein n=1 Tax=Methanoregula sp. TaxID=2052170 RepID=UPI000CC7B596|nr:hypothetical protein [Methanoregula sp.]PKG33097.1 MAG: hypothetical protein CW742_04700 [Methanoregula sp.]